MWDKPLHKLAINSRVEELNELLRASPDLIETKGFNGMSPLMVAARRGQEKAVSLLLSLGASPAAIDDSGWTALHHASCQGHVGAQVLLLLHHSTHDVDARNNEGASPLLIAVTEGHIHAVRALLSFGADPSLQDNKGRTAVDLALACTGGKQAMGSELVQLLQMGSYQSYSLARLWALNSASSSPSLTLEAHGTRQPSRPVGDDGDCDLSQVLQVLDLSVHALSPDTFMELRQYLF